MRVYIIHRHAGKDYAPNCMEVAAINQEGQVVHSKAYPNKHRRASAELEVRTLCGEGSIDQSLAPKKGRIE